MKINSHKYLILSRISDGSAPVIHIRPRFHYVKINTSCITIIRVTCPKARTNCQNQTIASPESRVFILVALARVNASDWFNIMINIIIILNQLLAFTRASATRIKTRDSGLPMTRRQKHNPKTS